MSRSRSSSGTATPVGLHVYADSICRSRPDGEFGGYGVYCPFHSIRISEPLPGKVQTLERGELAALHSALELVHGLRSLVAVVYMHSPQVVDGYVNRLRTWEANQWRTESGHAVRNRKIWRDIWHLWNGFLDRGVDLTVQIKDRNSDHNMRVANRLAKRGTTLHVTCELCRKTHGRQWGNHGCEPICDLDDCNGRVMKNVQAYMRHMRRRHQKKCRRKDCEQGFATFLQEALEEHEREAHNGCVFQCEYCGRYFKSPRKVKRHIRSNCKEAPYCADCGRLFKSRRELAQHNLHKTSESESSSESDDTNVPPSDEEDEVLDDEVGIDLARHDFGRSEFGSKSFAFSRSKSLPSLGRDEEENDEDFERDDSESESESESDTCNTASSSSNSEFQSRKCRKHESSRHRGSRHGSNYESRHGNKHGSKHGSSRHKHHHRHGHKHGHHHRHKHDRGLVVNDRSGRELFLDELDLREHEAMLAKQQVRREATPLPKSYRYGAGSE